MMQNFMAKEKGKIVLTSTIEEYYIFCDYMQIGSLRNVHLWLFSTFDPTALACFLLRCRRYQRSNAAAGIGLANKNPDAR